MPVALLKSHLSGLLLGACLVERCKPHSVGDRPTPRHDQAEIMRGSYFTQRLKITSVVIPIIDRRWVLVKGATVVYMY